MPKGRPALEPVQLLVALLTQLDEREQAAVRNLTDFPPEFRTGYMHGFQAAARVVRDVSVTWRDA